MHFKHPSYSSTLEVQDQLFAKTNHGSSANFPNFGMCLQVQTGNEVTVHIAARHNPYLIC